MNRPSDAFWGGWVYAAGSLRILTNYIQYGTHLGMSRVDKICILCSWNALHTQLDIKLGKKSILAGDFEHTHGPNIE